MTLTGILSGYIDRPTLAIELGCSERTLARYETMPDGLPSTLLAGRKLYRLENVSAWILARETKRNPRRGAA